MSSQVGVHFCLDGILYNHRFMRCYLNYCLKPHCISLSTIKINILMLQNNVLAHLGCLIDAPVCLHHSRRLARLIALFKPLANPAATGTDLYWCGQYSRSLINLQFLLKPDQIRS